MTYLAPFLFSPFQVPFIFPYIPETFFCLFCAYTRTRSGPLPPPFCANVGKKFTFSRFISFLLPLPFPAFLSFFSEKKNVLPPFSSLAAF